jgi:predicted ATP-dependent serine protease
LHFQFQEEVEGFYNSMQEISRDEAIAAIEETDALREFFGGNPQSQFTETLNQQIPDQPKIPLRTIHTTAVIAGLNSAQVGKINVIALEGNPGIGKTTAVIKFLQQQSQGFMFLYVSPRVVINRDVTKKLARNNGKPSGILTMTTNADLINSASNWYEEQVKQKCWKPRPIDSAVVIDGIENLNHPDCSTVFVTPKQEQDIDCNQLETVFSYRYFMASSELNLLNTILLEDDEPE